MFGSLSFKLPETFLQILNWKAVMSAKNMCQEARCLPGVFLPSPYKPWVQSRGSWHQTWSLCPRYTHIILGARLEMILSPGTKLILNAVVRGPGASLERRLGVNRYGESSNPFQLEWTRNLEEWVLKLHEIQINRQPASVLLIPVCLLCCWV